MNDTLEGSGAMSQGGAMTLINPFALPMLRKWKIQAQVPHLSSLEGIGEFGYNQKGILENGVSMMKSNGEKAICR
jgi:hypothetical protein